MSTAGPGRLGRLLKPTAADWPIACPFFGCASQLSDSVLGNAGKMHGMQVTEGGGR